jgi:hypothetical protein
MSRFSLTLIGAGVGLTIGTSVLAIQMISQKLMPSEYCLLLLGGLAGTGAIVGRVGDRRTLAPPSLAPLTQSATVLQPHNPESAENAALYTETCATIAHHLCQVQTGTEEYQEALIAGAATTVNLRSALVGDVPRSRWQDAVSRWQAASTSSSDHAIDPISGAPTLFASPSQEEPSHAANSTPSSDPGGSALPEPPQALVSFLGSGSSADPAPPVEESIPAGVGASNGASDHNGGSFSLDDGWD